MNKQVMTIGMGQNQNGETTRRLQSRPVDATVANRHLSRRKLFKNQVPRFSQRGNTIL